MTDLPRDRRVEIARVIDPNAFNTGAGYVRMPPGLRIDRRARALAKADAIMALPDLMGEGVVSSVDESAARIEALPRTQHSDGWRDISTAPKDGTTILAWTVHDLAKYSTDPVAEGYACVSVISWTDFNGGGWTWNGLCGVHTHWKPAPAPPSSGELPISPSEASAGNPSTDVTISLNPTDVERAR